MKLQNYDAVILGAGASGLVCARAASARGLSVLVIDHGARAGRKLSITGGGKCNLTNLHVNANDYVGGTPGFWRSALARFRTEDMLAIADEAGIALEEREHGQLFCKRSAKDIVNFLMRSCEKQGCAFAFDERVLSARRAGEEGGFVVQCSGKSYSGRNLIVATGGLAWPQVGATGIGYELAKSFGHRIVPLRPALVGLVMPADWTLSGLSGVSTNVSVSVCPNTWSIGNVPEASVNLKNGRGRSGKGQQPILAADTLPLLFTHKGISGPAALQASLYWRKGMQLQFDFQPGENINEIISLPEHGKVLSRNVLRKYLPDRLCDALMPEALGSKRTAELSRKDRDLLASRVHEHRVIPEGYEKYTKAEVTAGGVDTGEVSSKTMQSNLVPGLYFCGEVLDVTGRLGGYNLHWAFASGHAAGIALM